jgi:hypothetical protein
LFSRWLPAWRGFSGGGIDALVRGDDWAEDDDDVELMDAAGRVLARKRLPEGAAGTARLHELMGEHLGLTWILVFAVGPGQSGS